jgi:hypothetical protein
MQLLAEKSWGLYQRAAMESGGFFNWAYQPMEKASKTYDKIIKRLHWTNSSGGPFNCSRGTAAARVACLRFEAPTDALMRIDSKMSEDSWCGKHLFFNHFETRTDHFTKTGSGQTSEALSKKARFSAGMNRSGRPCRTVSSSRATRRLCAKRLFWRHFYTKNDQFAKTGSGQT